MKRAVPRWRNLVDALVSGTSGASREGSSPFLGTNSVKLQALQSVSRPRRGPSRPTKRALWSLHTHLVELSFTALERFSIKPRRFVIASKAKQSRLPPLPTITGLLRRFASRNDDFSVVENRSSGSRPAGHLFLKVAPDGNALGPLQAVKNRFAEFARKIVTDPNVAPLHGWRHRFKTIGMEAGIPNRVLDAIQPHAPLGPTGRRAKRGGRLPHTR